MNLFSLSLAYLRRRPWGTLLNVVLLALGLATIVVLLLFSRQFEGTLARNAQGIDLVVGAKGSPLQLILSAVYHIDTPTGNIAVADAEALMRHPMVQQAIPLALGDSYRGYRIVGSTPAYLDLYGAAPAQGARWEDEMEVVLGASVAAETGARVGDEIVSAHGLSAEGEAHADRPLQVKGILAPTGTVLDRLVLTSVETVWAVHDEHGAHDDEHGDEAHSDETSSHDAPSDHADDEHADHADEAATEAPAVATPPVAAPMSPVPMVAPGGLPMGGLAAPGLAGSAPAREYTALLITYRSPIAFAMFPRFVNSQTNLQAAQPAAETQRLLGLLGVGLDALRAFGFVLILASALGVGIALYNALQERRYDLAMLRTLGASRSTLLAHVLLEGFILAGLGTLLGLLLGHAATSILGATLANSRTSVPLTGWTFAPAEVGLIALALGLGVLAALIPAIQAYRTDIARTLARG